MRLYAAELETPIGTLWLLGGEEGLLAVRIAEGEPFRSSLVTYDPEALALPLEELRGYFKGEVRTFRTPLLLVGTPFELRVWEWVRGIPWGETRTYGEVADGIGMPGAARAVGRALKANSLPIFIPCHRVLAAKGLGGYSMGLRVKRWLLEHEGALGPRRERPG